METYPAQIRVVRIEKEEQKEFTLKVYDKQPPRKDRNIDTLLDKSETDQYDYSIYAYQVNVNIIIKGEETSLREAILQNKITMEEILEKANQEIQEPIVYKDGGSKEYHYDLYTIIKCHRLQGEGKGYVEDVYIGSPQMNINDIL